jgi:hypothetical protein
VAEWEVHLVAGSKCDGFFLLHVWSSRDRNSVVGIENRYRLGGSGFESRRGMILSSKPVQTVLGAQPSRVMGFLLGVMQSGRVLGHPPPFNANAGSVLPPFGTYTVSYGVFLYAPEGWARLQVSYDNDRCQLIKVCVEKLSCCVLPSTLRWTDAVSKIFRHSTVTCISKQVSVIFF